MWTAGSRPTRRAVLTAGLGAGAVLAGAPWSASAAASPAAAEDAGVARRLRALEREHGARLGVFARDTGSGRTVLHRADELFPMCSVFKTVAVAAVLRDLDRDGEVLARRVFYTQQDVKDSGFGPVTGLPENVAGGLTVEQLCAAAICRSDNAAANLLLRQLGGPQAVTRFCRSLGDRTTRLDRWEPELNTAEPGRVTDTTTPRAIAGTYAALALGDALAPRDRERLTGWLLANTTSTERFRKGLPADWVLADKTGGGDYGTNNDAGITWPPHRPPIVLTVLTTHDRPEATADNPLVAETAALLAAALS
ncbi:class A beta-lactamase [Streptomyces sp. NPDC059982]|uniref:class A beta-lactamase n=1 Tax=unclassified Streptomyces TaxID=2593676 RepID=UPI0036B80659